MRDRTSSRRRSVQVVAGGSECAHCDGRYVARCSYWLCATPIRAQAGSTHRDAWLEVNPAFIRALSGLRANDEIIVITWLDRAHRDVLEVHPRSDPANPLTGVFATRSPHRPNPLGLHRATVRQIGNRRIRIGPIEALDGTPVVDVKPVLDARDR